jgi:hypothetical protein
MKRISRCAIGVNVFIDHAGGVCYACDGVDLHMVPWLLTEGSHGKRGHRPTISHLVIRSLPTHKLLCGLRHRVADRLHRSPQQQ